MIHNRAMRTTFAHPTPLPFSALTSAVSQRAFLLPILGPSLLVLGLGACADPAEKVAESEPASDDGGDTGEEGWTEGGNDGADGEEGEDGADAAGDGGEDGGGETGSDEGSGETGDTGETPHPLTAAECFTWQLPDDGVSPVDYDVWSPVIGSHCRGTDHQDILGVERVVFAGDSITVGTPPTAAADFYRNVMAEGLVDRFGLDGPDWLWQNVDLINGVALSQTSGDFAVCAKWGARTDDLTRAPHEQIQTCIPEEERSKVHLVVMTVGGNDLFAWAQDLRDGVPPETLWLEAEQAVVDLEDSVRWLKEDPARFPNGVHVIFANNFAFTDTEASQDFSTCPGADLIGMDVSLVEPEFMAMAAWMQGEMMRIAATWGADMVFMGENACGHGHMRDDTDGRCYRGPDTELWLDVTCMHPSAEGHAGIAGMFMSVIDE